MITTQKHKTSASGLDMIIATGIVTDTMRIALIMTPRKNLGIATSALRTRAGECYTLSITFDIIKLTKTVLSQYPSGGGSFYLDIMKLEKYELSEYYKDLAKEVIQEHEDLHWLWNVRIDYAISLKQKKSQGMSVFGECIKVKDWEQLYIPYDFIIMIYELNAMHLPREVHKRLLHHELLHIGVNEKDGELKYKVNPHDIQDFRAIINEYGLDWIDG